MFIKPFLNNTDPHYRANIMSDLYKQVANVEIPIFEGINHPSFYDYKDEGVYIIESGCKDLPEGDSGILFLILSAKVPSRLFLPAGPTGHFWVQPELQGSWVKE